MRNGSSDLSLLGVGDLAGCLGPSRLATHLNDADLERVSLTPWDLAPARLDTTYFVSATRVAVSAVSAL